MTTPTITEQLAEALRKQDAYHPLTTEARNLLARFDAAQQAPVRIACVCGQPDAPGVVHRAGGGCYAKQAGEQALPPLPEPDLIARGMTWDDADKLTRECAAQAGVDWGNPKPLAINVLHRVAQAAHKLGWQQALDRAAQAAQPLPVRDERAAFEAWFCRAYDHASLRPKEAGCYLERGAGMAWDAWQARAARAQQPAQAVPLSTEAVTQGAIDQKCTIAGGEFPEVCFSKGVRFAERAHGIGVKLAGGGEGGNA